jgi:mannitol/fructose-specific phosphotransferase system IIA component (Ntr-type)
LLASLAGIFRVDETRRKLLETSDAAQIRAIFGTQAEIGDTH